MFHTKKYNWKGKNTYHRSVLLFFENSVAVEIIRKALGRKNDGIPEKITEFPEKRASGIFWQPRIDSHHSGHWSSPQMITIPRGTEKEPNR